MVHGGAGDRFAELKRNHAQYTVFDESYERLGKVDELFVVENDHLAYIGLSKDLLDVSLAPVPVEIIRVNDKRQVVVIEDSRENLERAPIIRNEEEMSFELEARIRSYFGLDPDRTPVPEPRQTGTPDAEDFAPDDRIDTVPGERKEAEEIEAEPPLDKPDRHGSPGVRRLR